MLGFKTHFSIALLSALTLGLTGCFQNISGTDAVTKKSSQSNFQDNGGGTLNGTFNGTSILASTALGGLVGSYASSASTLGNVHYGLMINLRIPLENSIGADVLADLLNRVDADTGVQNIDVTLQIPQFGIKLTFKFSKVAYGNNKILRNVISVRPDLGGVDVGAGYVPDSAPVLQQSSGYVFTYGGLGNGGVSLARLTILYNDNLTGATGFLPNVTSNTWGVGFPDNSSPQANAAFMPLTPRLGTIFSKLYTDPNTAQWTGDQDFADVGSNPSKYMLSIHRDPATNAITQAWIINPIVAAPKGVLLCSSVRNSLEYRVVDPATANTATPAFWYVGDKAACNCPKGDPEVQPSPVPVGGPVMPTGIFEPCAAPNVDGTPSNRANSATNKITYLNEAINNRIPTPASGSFLGISLPKVSNGVTINTL